MLIVFLAFLGLGTYFIDNQKPAANCQ